MGVTEKQKRVMDFGEGNLLVSASAGSGKTFVMIERLTRLIIEGKADLDEILCVTFTVSAAKEMKQKLAKKINEKIAEGGDDGRLVKQLELLPAAQISTMHSFCKNVLSEFFYESGLDAAFSIADDKEGKRLVKRAIDRLFEDLYDEDDPNLNLLLPLYFKKRTDGDLKNKITEIYDDLISEADPFAILNKGAYYYTSDGVKEICEKLCDKVKSQARVILSELEKLRAVVSPHQKLLDFYCEIETFLTCVIKSGSYDETRLLLKTTKFSMPVVGKSKDENLLAARGEFKGFYDKLFKDFVEDSRECFGDITEEEEITAAENYAPIYNAFAYIVKRFSQYYSQEKREENLVDFSDLEHLCLKLLTENEAVKATVSERFKYVFADEYQDTNGVQEAILQNVARDNLFMVGDVKQSIYNFRGCNPDIFADKFAAFSKGEGGTAESLDCNFRSTNKVLAAVNNVFKEVMTPDFGRTDYAASPMIFGGGYPMDEGDSAAYFFPVYKKEKNKMRGVYGVVKHLNNLLGGDGFEEGKAAASLIESVVGSDIYDLKLGKKRPATYGDFAVLLRNTKGLADKYARELTRAGIPVCASSKKGSGDYPEIAFLRDLVLLIGCFNQDIPLVSVLKSKVGGLTDAELFKIRENSPGGAFYEAYRAYLKDKDDELSAKLNAFDEYFSKIRLLSAFLPCDELLGTIVREKQIDVAVLSMRLGEQRLARINAFIEAAGAKKRTINEFLPYMQGVIDSLSVDYSENDAVKITSIHNSKGLEYPIVILGGLDRAYNTDNLTGELITDRDYGIALKFRDDKTMRERDSVLRRFVKLKKSTVMKEEESRLLYVAMTRAKNRLYLLCAAKEKKTGIEQPFKEKRFPLPGTFANKYSDLFALSDMRWEFTGDNIELTSPEPRKVLIGNADPALTKRISSALSFSYPGGADVGLPLKRSVTAAAHFDEEDSAMFEYAPIYGGASEEKGTAYHKFLELCDFSKDPESELNRLIAAHSFENGGEKLIDKARLKAIMKMPVFKLLNGFTLYREQPFTCYMPASFTESGYGGNGKVLVQGIIDLLAVKGDEAVILDYKFTSLKNDEDLVKRYKKQMFFYAYAVENVLKKRVKEVWLVNIYAGRAVKVDLAENSEEQV